MQSLMTALNSYDRLLVTGQLMDSGLIASSD